MRITADTSRCVGAGQCVLAAPEIFEKDEDAHVVVTDGSPSGSDLYRVHQAVVRCPSGAIILAED